MVHNEKYDYDVKSQKYTAIIQRIMQDPPNELLPLLLSRFLSVDALSEKVQDLFERKKLFEFNPEGVDKYPTHIHLQALCIAYLKMLRETIKADNRHISFERANERDGKPSVEKTNRHEFSDLLFDPIGGLYVSELKQRREYLNKRSLFMKSLWDFSVKNKKHLFDLEKK